MQLSYIYKIKFFVKFLENAKIQFHAGAIVCVQNTVGSSETSNTF